MKIYLNKGDNIVLNNETPDYGSVYVEIPRHTNPDPKTFTKWFEVFAGRIEEIEVKEDR